MKNVLFVGLVVLGLIGSSVQAATKAQADTARTTMTNTKADCIAVSADADDAGEAALSSKNAAEMKYMMYKMMNMGQGIPAVDAALAQANDYYDDGNSSWDEGNFYRSSGMTYEMSSDNAYTTADGMTDPTFKSMWFQDSINYASDATLRYGTGYWYSQYHYNLAIDNFVNADCYFDAAYNLIP